MGNSDVATLTTGAVLRARWTWLLVLGSILVSACTTTETGITAPLVVPLSMPSPPKSVAPPHAPRGPSPIIVPPPGPQSPPPVLAVPSPTASTSAINEAGILDAVSVTGKVQHIPAPRSASGTVQAQVKDRNAAAAAANDRLKLSQKARTAEYGFTSKDHQAADYALRIAELSRNVEELKRLQQGEGVARGGSGGASVAAASETNAASAVDGLAPAKVAWNTPPKMALGETAEVELRVTLDENLFPGIADRVRAGGATTSETIELSRDLTAKLESTAFDVKPDGERRQAVLKGRDAVWSWVISPKLKGKQKLLLSITVHVADGPSIAPLVRTIEVTAGASEMTDAVKDFLVKNWEKLLTVIHIPLGLWGWKVHRKRSEVLQTSPLPALPPEGIRDAA